MRALSVLFFALLLGCSERSTSQEGDAPPPTTQPPATDSGIEDAAVPRDDAGAIEDAGNADSGASSDAGLSDAGLSDASIPLNDAGSEDAGSEDAGSEDAGSRLRNCDQRSIACRLLPPSCPPGQLPEVEGTCWTGACVSLNRCGCTEHDACGPEGMYACHRGTHCGDWL